jgi:SLT domain-containing protein
MGNVPEGERRELIAKALQLAGQPVTDSALAAVNTIVEKESSWNPKARNDWDINAKNGIPSQGLMQTIPPTFKENALPGYDKDITDPLSNLIAGIRYSTKRYGSVEEVVRRTKSGGKNQGY